MLYNKNYSLWVANFTPEIGFQTGNFSYYVGATDEVGEITNSTESINITILNNHPIMNYIQVCVGVDRIPSDQLTVGVDLVIKGNASDIEGLKNMTAIISDNFGNSINQTLDLQGKISDVLFIFNQTLYSSLETDEENDWTISLILYDIDSEKTIDFNTDNQLLNQTEIHIMPYITQEPIDFPFEIIIIIAIIAIIVIGVFIVYKNIRQKEVVVPAKDVKRIIKKISEEEETKVEEEEKKFEETPTYKEEVPVKLSQEEIEEIEVNIKDNLKRINTAVDKYQYKRVAELYRYIANLAEKIEKKHVAKTYLDKAKEYDELYESKPKKKWKKLEKKAEKEEEEPEEAEPGELTQEEYEAINSEIGSATRKAREALRKEEYESAIELYEYAAKLAFKINNRRKASIFTKRANEILRKLDEK
jgi:hypothetical protein